MLQARPHRRIYWVHAVWDRQCFSLFGRGLVDFLSLA
jgi:hypothetical protein